MKQCGVIFVKRCLVMITSSFPFGSGESFIESEISFHESKFDRIIILPIELDPNAELTRAVPENAEYYNVSVKKQKIARTGDILKGVHNLVVPTEYLRYDRQAIGTSLRRRMFFEYFCNRSQRSFGECKSVLEKCGLDEYDSITVYSYWFFVTALVGVKLKEYLSSFCPDVELVARAHRYDVYENANVLGYLPLRRYLLEKYDAVYPCSDSGTKFITEKYPEYSSKVKTAYLGTFDHGLSKQSENGLHIVSCSQVKDVKRVDEIVDIIELFAKSGNRNIKWTHIGTGNREAELKKAVKLKLNGVETELLGKLPNTEVCEYYRKNPVDLFISASKSEGLPVSMMEAASFGVPILSTNVGGVSELVCDGFNGWLLDEDAEIGEFVRILDRFYDMEKSEREVYRNNIRQTWEKGFDASRSFRDFLSVPAVVGS